MTTQKMLLLALAGALVPTAAHAARATAKFVEVIPAPTTDLAPTTGTGESELLKMGDERQPGNEMATFAMFDDGVTGLYFAMTTELNGTRATDRIQLSMTSFALSNTADGVTVTPDVARASFVTSNIGNEYRNANHPGAFTINGGKAICVTYNWQPNNANNTKRYMECFAKPGADGVARVVMPQTQVYAKTNDDCSMHQDGQNDQLTALENGRINHFVAWHGCNGNGADDGWMQSYTISCDDAANPTSCTFAQAFDVSVCPREERSHGRCTASFGDPNTAICTWTEGNTQPQRDGTWMAAVDITPGAFTGNNRQGSILWKQQVEGRIESGNLTTYSMRAMTERLQEPAPANTAGVAVGTLVNSDKLIWRSGDLQGNNNEDKKGGTYYRNKMAVIRATRTGMSYVMPMTDVAQTLQNLDGTHLSMTFGMFGDNGDLKPGISFLMGSHTGGGEQATARVALYDAAANKIVDGTAHGIGPYDRHLYPNYLGNNPGNQGRNYSQGMTLVNPFFGQAGADKNTQYLQVFATTGKSEANKMNPKIKLSAFLSVLPIATAKEVVVPPTTPDPTTPTMPTEPTDPSTTNGSDSLGGCSTGGNTTGGAMGFLVLGAAALLRRRRRN